jgi:MFS family permease
VLGVLRVTAYRRLFIAQVVALLGTGLLTVALGLLAFDLAGGRAGVVVSTALTIKMAAYVLIPPVMTAVVHRLPRRGVLVAADLVRAGVAVCLPWVDQTWQIYVLVFALQAASATFTPTFQAVIPAVLPDRGQYTRAISMSRLAYDLESIVSPLLAALLLSWVSYNNLFFGTVAGFVASASLVVATRLPKQAPQEPGAGSLPRRIVAGVRLFWTTRALRAVLALNVVVAAGTALVLVNTVVLVQSQWQRPQATVAVLLACYGGGSMLVAVFGSPVMDRLRARAVLLTGAIVIPSALTAAAVVTSIAAPGSLPMAGTVWALLGAGNALILIPSMGVIRDVATPQNQPAVFAAQFSLSHLCFAATYPVAGLLGATLGLSVTSLVLAAVAATAAALAGRLTGEQAPPAAPSGGGQRTPSVQPAAAPTALAAPPR